ncbi:hypothetical protein ACEUBT_17760 [Aeromonas bivalvium]
MNMGSISATSATISLMMANIIPDEVAATTPSHGAGKESQP